MESMLVILMWMEMRSQLIKYSVFGLLGFLISEGRKKKEQQHLYIHYLFVFLALCYENYFI